MAEQEVDGQKTVENTESTEPKTEDKKEDEKEEENKGNVPEDKAEVRKRRVFVHPIIPRDLNDAALKPYLDKATLVISRFIGVKGSKKRGHVVLWYKTAEEAAEMAEQLKDVVVGERQHPVTVQVAEGVTVPVAMIMEDWHKNLCADEEAAAKQRMVFVNNLPPGTPKELVRVLFPVATSIELSVDDEGNPTGHAVLTFETKREAEICIKNATGIKVANHALTMHLVETEEELNKAKEEAEKNKKEAEEKKSDDSEKKEIEKDKRDIDREAKAVERGAKDDDDDEDNRKRKGRERDASGDDSKKGRFERRGSYDRGRSYQSRGGRGQWRGGGGFGGGGMGNSGDGSLMGLLSTLQQVQQLQQRGSRGGGGRGGWW